MLSFIHQPVVHTSFVAALLVCSPTSAGIINGDFSDTSGTPFAGWQTESAPFIEAPSANSGTATFVVDDFFDDVVQLEQTFTLPNNVSKLVFDFKLADVDGGILNPIFGAPPYDSFQARLLDPTTFSPLLSLDNLFGLNNPFEDRFFAVESTGDTTATGVSTDPNVGNGFTRVTVDTASFGGRQVLLDFRLLGEDDGLVTTVELNSVSLQLQRSNVVPEPVSMLCWMPACMRFLFRRRNR